METIEVKLDTGTVSLTVEPDDTVYTLKQRMANEEKTSTPPDQQILTCNGIVMENDQKLSAYEVKKGSTICLLWPLIVRLNGKTITIKVEPFNNIESVKRKIQNVEDILVSHQFLSFAGKELENDKSLADYNIKSNDTIDLQCITHIVIKLSTGKTNTLDVKPHNTVKEIKQIMEETEGIPLNQQKLYYAGYELENNQSVSECHFNDYCEVHLVCRSRSPIQIKVLTPDSKQVTLTVDGTDTIETIKRKMPTEFSPSQHALFFAGKELQDNLMLYDHSIQNGSMLYLKYKEPALPSTLPERFLEPFNRYQLLTFYVDFPSTRVWNVHFVVIDNCTSTREKVLAEMKLYKKGESEVFFSFKDSAISLAAIKEEVLNGWKILPLQSPLKIYKKDVDYYCSYQGILPKVAIRVEALSDSLKFTKNVPISGTNDPNHSITLSLLDIKDATSPVTCDSVPSINNDGTIACSDPSFHDLMNDVAAEAPDQWISIGLLLGISLPDLISIKTNNENDKICYAHVFHIWKTAVTRPYSWETMVDVLKSKLINAAKLAEAIHKKYLSNS